MKIRRLLFPTDFSENSQAALPLVHSLLEENPQATLHVLHVIEPMVATADFGWSGLDLTDLEQRREDGARRALVEFAGELGLPPGRVEVALERGRGHEAICDYAAAHDIDLVAMATHGHSGLGHLLLGSTTEMVVRGAPCPVLTTRARDGG